MIQLAAVWLAMAWLSGMFLPDSSRVVGRDRTASAFARTKKFMNIDGRRVAYVEEGSEAPRSYCCTGAAPVRWSGGQSSRNSRSIIASLRRTGSALVRHRIFGIAVHDERRLSMDDLAEWVTPRPDRPTTTAAAADAGRTGRSAMGWPGRRRRSRPPSAVGRRSARPAVRQGRVARARTPRRAVDRAADAAALQRGSGRSYAVSAVCHLRSCAGATQHARRHAHTAEKTHGISLLACLPSSTW